MAMKSRDSLFLVITMINLTNRIILSPILHYYPLIIYAYEISFPYD